MNEIIYSAAKVTDEIAVKALLQQCDLPFEDISGHLPNFIIAKSEGKVVGVIGCEVYGHICLARSLAVDPASCNRGIGKQLITRLFDMVQKTGINELYILTQTAVEYSSKFGFHKVPRNTAPESIQATLEFKSLCPVTSVCMLKRLEE